MDNGLTQAEAVDAITHLAFYAGWPSAQAARRRRHRAGRRRHGRRATRQTYTVYGDTVNLAQRLEQLNKELGTLCLICRTTFEAARPAWADAAPMGSLQVPGREAAVEVLAVGQQGASAPGTPV